MSFSYKAPAIWGGAPPAIKVSVGGALLSFSRSSEPVVKFFFGLAGINALSGMPQETDLNKTEEKGENVTQDYINPGLSFAPTLYFYPL